MGNSKYYNSENASVYGNGYNNSNENCCNNEPSYDTGFDPANFFNNDDDNRKCCGKRFNNRKDHGDKKVQRALEAFEKQLDNTDEAIDCLNNVFNCLEDTLFEERCCLSGRIKNILKAIQTEICDLEDDVRDIRDDLVCLEQAL